MSASQEGVNQGKNFGAVRAIFFDLDDTLCAYWDASKAAMKLAFQLHGPVGVSVQEMIAHWAAAFREFSPTIKKSDWYQGYLKSGEATRTEQMRLALRRAGIADEQRARLLSRVYMEERDRALRLSEDAEEVLDALTGRYALGLITNGPADIQRQEIRTLGLERYFDPILIEGELGEGKPGEAVFTRAAEAVRCEPSEILFVGNSYAHDVLPAMKYGWHAVWVRRASDVPPSFGPGTVAPEEIPDGGILPDATIASLRELLGLLPPVA